MRYLKQNKNVDVHISWKQPFNKRNDDSFCKKCKDRSWLISCEGCGEVITRKTKWYDMRTRHKKCVLNKGKSKYWVKESKPCECGCTRLASKGKRFLSGHNRTGGEFKITRNYFCIKCRDKNWLVECGTKEKPCRFNCGKIRTRASKHGDFGYYISGHEPKRTTKPEYLKPKKGSEHHMWKGGKKIHQGYVLVLKPDHARAQKSGYIPQHILVAEQMLGRPLKKGEVVNHLNGIRNDNRAENLQVLESQSKHAKAHHFLEGKRVLSGDRKCCVCDSEKTRMRKYKDYEVPEWYAAEEGKWACRRCNNRLHAKIQYEKNVSNKPKIPGKRRTRAGYIRIKVPGHPRSDRKGWVLEHIVVAEQKIERPLYPNEQVHHIDENKENNNPSNLVVMDGIEHNSMHGFKREGRRKIIIVSQRSS